MATNKYESVRQWVDESIANIYNQLQSEEIDHYMVKADEPEIDGTKAEADGITYLQAYHLSLYSTMLEFREALKTIESGKSPVGMYHELTKKKKKEAMSITDMFKKAGVETTVVRINGEDGSSEELDPSELPEEIVESLEKLLKGIKKNGKNKGDKK